MSSTTLREIIDVFAIGAPDGRIVVARVEGELDGVAAIGVDNIDVELVLVRAHTKDPFAIRRQRRSGEATVSLGPA